MSYRHHLPRNTVPTSVMPAAPKLSVINQKTDTPLEPCDAPVRLGRFAQPTNCPYHHPRPETSIIGVHTPFTFGLPAGNDIAMVAMAADVVGNFLRYNLQHDVCPEYAEGIDNALQVCDKAVEEPGRIEGIIYPFSEHSPIASRLLPARRCGKTNTQQDRKDGMAVTLQTNPREAKTPSSESGMTMSRLFCPYGVSWTALSYKRLRRTYNDGGHKQGRGGQAGDGV
ncbi:hypothetical protein QBC44DRAFT_308905 [Cladorrhinum sp. PSN332]|nr:hypothetical protein QBC44DRAFT_308905 [Cladorrhinum sp. PSN332]